MQDALSERFFRQVHADLIAHLTRKFGAAHFALIEDAVQASLTAAWERWQITLPEKPEAWLYRVAHNHLIDELRKCQTQLEYHRDTAVSPLHTQSDVPSFSESATPNDDLLHLIFLCCDPNLPAPSRLVLTLKVLCGMSIQTIAHRLFQSEAGVQKRYQRARKILSEIPDPPILSASVSTVRLDSVLRVLYLLFTEGYLTQAEDFAIRSDLCEEAVRLLHVLLSKQIGQKADAFALMALFSFNLARLSARRSEAGHLLLLSEQDRANWDRTLIKQGFHYLARSAFGEVISPYHLEAAIAAEHCRARDLASTNWEAICQYYLELEARFPTFLYRLNRLIALAEWQGPQVALHALQAIPPPSWLENSYLWLSVAADLHSRCGHLQRAAHFTERALDCAPNSHTQALLKRRLNLASSLTQS